MNKLSKEIKSIQSYIKYHNQYHSVYNNNNNKQSLIINSESINNSIYNNKYLFNHKNNNNNNNNHNKIINNLYSNHIVNNSNRYHNNNNNRYYFSNGLYKNKRIIYNVFSSKSLTAFLLFCYAVPISPVYYIVTPVFIARMFEIIVDTIKTNKFYEYSMIQIQQHRDEIQSIMGRSIQLPSASNCKFYRHNNSNHIDNNNQLEKVININNSNRNNNNEKKKKKENHIINNNNNNSSSNNSSSSSNQKNNNQNEFSTKVNEIFTDIKDTPRNYLDYYHKNKNYMVCKFDVLDSNQSDSKATIEVICNYIPSSFKDFGKKIPLEDKFNPKYIKITLIK